jgi:NAD(P)H-hydrate epimerase
VAARGGKIVIWRAQNERIVVTAAEQRHIDALALERGAAPDDLIESAGKAAAEWILDHAAVQRAAVVAGPGGNGADALVVARRLLAAGRDVRAFLFGPSGPVSESVNRALRRLQAAGGSATAVDGTDLGPLERAAGWANVAIDGLYGSGLSRPLEGAAVGIVDLLNRAQVLTISLDVPSGIQADAGDVPGPAVKADVTLAMEFLKPAHFLFPASGLCGNVVVVSVDYAPDALADVMPWARVLDRAGARRRLPPRSPTGHKGTFGHGLLLAGSRGMVGAALLAGRSALRAGLGLLTIGIPASLAATVHSALPEALVVPLAEEDGCLVPDAVAQLEPSFGHVDVLAIGPGLSRSEGTCEAVCATLEAYDGPVVVDADALYATSQRPETLAALAGRAILTPHPGELAFFTGASATEIDRRRVEEAARFAVGHGVITILKGRPTVIAFPGGARYLNPTGNAGLATGGSGDVLTGLLAGLLAGGATLEDAALVGPYVHGAAAEIFSLDRSERSLVPSDIVELLPRAFREIERCA